MKCPLKARIIFMLFYFLCVLLLFICFISRTMSLGNLATIVDGREIAPYKVIRNPESGIQVILVCGIRNPRLWNPESTSWDPESNHNCNPESRLLGMESGTHGCGIRNSQTWNPESTTWNPESKTLLDYLTWGEGRSTPHHYDSNMKKNMMIQSSSLSEAFSKRMCSSM